MTSITRKDTLEFTGELLFPDDLSAVDLVGDFLVLGSDEGNAIQILKRKGGHKTHFEVIATQPLNTSGDETNGT